MSAIRCKECLKEDVCPYQEEYKRKLEENSADSGSPIYTTVGCRSAAKKPTGTLREDNVFRGINNYCEQNRID